MKNGNQAHFYGDVDRARYRANWSCLIWFFVLAAIAIGAGWFLLRYLGYI